jgi:uncharacterized protein (TIGR03437 family)
MPLSDFRRLSVALASGAVTLAHVFAQTPAVTWTPVGPHHITGSGSVDSGKLQAIAVFPGDPRIIYAGGGVGTGIEGPLTASGIFKTIDGGATWVAVNKGLDDAAINTLWVDPTNADVVLAGTDHQGIYRSTDGGQSWSFVTIPITSSGQGGPSATPAASTAGPVSEFAVFDTNILAGGQSGLLRSTDRGATWAVFAQEPSPVKAVQSAGGVVAIGLQNGAVQVRPTSTSPFKLAIANTGGSALCLAIDAAAPTSIYLVVGPSSPALFGTSDGTTWAKLPFSQTPQAVAVTPSSHKIYVGTNNALFSSTDGGQTWTSVPGAHWSVRRIFLPDNNTVILGSDQGIHETTNDGTAWSDLSGAITASLTESVATHAYTILTVDNTFQPVVSYDAGATWSQGAATLPRGQSGMAAVNPGDSNFWYAFTPAGFQVSTDRGKTFKTSGSQGLGNGSFPSLSGESLIAVDGATPSNVYVAAASDFFVSKDFGATMAPSGWGLAKPMAIAASPANSSVLFAGTATGLSRSTDGGKTWTAISLAGAAGFPGTIAVSPTDPNLVLVGMSKDWTNGGGVLKSSDGGSTFRLFNDGLPSTLPTASDSPVIPAIRFSLEGAAAMATFSGVYLSTGGSAWQNISANSVPTTFNDVAWDGSYLYAATLGNGVLRSQPFGPPSATLSADLTPLSFTVSAGGSAAAPQSIGVSASAERLPFFTQAATAAGANWLSVTPADAVAPASIKVTVSAAGLAAGTYSGTVLIGSTSAGNGPLTIPVTLTVRPSNVTVSSVFNAASYDSTIAPNTWVTVQGQNLSATTRVWTSDDFSGVKLPTQLDGVSVQIGGRAALVYFVSPTQVNVLAPDNASRGTVQVQVNSPLGGSNSLGAVHDLVSPAFFPIAGKYIAAVHTDGVLVGPAEFVPGLPSRPAQPGETIELFGTGFGPTNPASTAATVNAPAPLLNNPILHFGGPQGMVATLSFAGMISPGLVQLNVTVPPGTANGDLAIVAETAGVTSGAGHFIAVQK